MTRAAGSEGDERGARADVSRLLYLDSLPARGLVVLFAVVYLTFTAATVDVLLRPWQSFVAVALVSVAGVLLVRSHPDPFPLRDTVIVLAIVVASTVLVASNLPDSGDLGRATWHLGGNTWLLFFLALRRRAWFAWLGMALMMAVTMLEGARRGTSITASALALDTHMGILLVATLFAVLLRRTAERIAALDERSMLAVAARADTDAAEEIRRVRAGELAEAAVPLLERIASGPPFTMEERSTFALAEARLRDTVRGRALAVPAIREAVDAARSRGVEVTLLDDAGTLPADGEAAQRLVDAVVDGLGRARSGTVTVRLTPPGRSNALTIVAASDGDVVRASLAPDGSPVETS